MGQNIKKRLLFHTISKDKLSDSIFSHAMVIYLYIAITNILINIPSNYPFSINYKWFISILICIIGLILIEKNKYLNFFKCIIAAFVLVFIVVTWLYKGGDNTFTLLYLFLIVLVITMIFENPLYTYIFSALSIILSIALIYIKYEYPEYMNTTIPDNLMFDSMLQMFILVTALLKLMHVYTSSYKAQNKKLEEHAYMDPLLEIYSRRRIMNNLLSYSLDENLENMYIMMLDIDNFKKINDAYGHIVGDTILIEISNKLKEIIGEWGHIGRYGGDEFLIFFQNLDFQKIHEIINKIIAVEIYFKSKKCTLSGGIVCLKQEEDAIAAISRADSLLLKAKDSGKNIIFKDFKSQGSL